MRAEMWGEYHYEEEPPFLYFMPQVLRQILPSRWERLKYKAVSLHAGLKLLASAYRKSLWWAGVKFVGFCLLTYAVIVMGLVLSGGAQ